MRVRLVRHFRLSRRAKRAPPPPRIRIPSHSGGLWRRLGSDGVPVVRELLEGFGLGAEAKRSKARSKAKQKQGLTEEEKRRGEKREETRRKKRRGELRAELRGEEKEEESSGRVEPPPFLLCALAKAFTTLPPFGNA